jgi:hypothetical protein
LPDLEEVEVLALVLAPVFALEDKAEVPLPVVVDLLLLPAVEEEEVVAGRFELDVPRSDLDDPVLEVDPELPLLPVLLLIPVLLPIDDEFEDPDVLPDMLPEPWFFSLSFIVKISWIYIVKKIRAK